MQSNRGRDTGPELALRQELHRRGFRYYVNRRPIPTLRRTADIVFPTKKVAVFVDGCFWHGCSEHHSVAKTNATFWANKVQATIERDEDTNAQLSANGWRVVRVWEHLPVMQAADQVEAALSS